MNDLDAPLNLPAWEEWPAGDGAVTWSDGERVDTSLVEWAATVGGFLGCGFRVRVPHGAADDAPLGFVHRQAQRVAESFGTRLDPAAWASMERVAGAGESLEIQGGWEYHLGKSFGGPWTRIAVGGRTHERARVVVAKRLPWAYGSDVPTAGLPLISQLEARRADRFLRNGPASIGLWFNHREELCSTTAGPVLVQTSDGTWIRPDDTSGFVDNWAFSEISSRLGVLPVVVDAETLAGARSLCAVSDLANLTLIDRVGPSASVMSADTVDTLLEVRRQVLPALGGPSDTAPDDPTE